MPCRHRGHHAPAPRPPCAQTSASRAPQLVPPRVAVTRGLGIDALIRPARNWTLVSLATPQAHTREGPLPWEKSSHNNNRYPHPPFLVKAFLLPMHLIGLGLVLNLSLFQSFLSFLAPISQSARINLLCILFFSDHLRPIYGILSNHG